MSHSESRLALYRSVLALGYQHNRINAENRVVLEIIFYPAFFKAGQVKILHDELIRPSSIDTIKPSITDEKDQKILEILEHSIEDQDADLQAVLTGLCPDLKPSFDDMLDHEWNMWRAIFSMVHADNVVRPEEESFLQHIMDTVDFSEEQREILKGDIETKRSVDDLFFDIGERAAQTRFFYIARLLCWSDGDFDHKEQDVIARLNKAHISQVNLDRMISVVQGD